MTDISRKAMERLASDLSPGEADFVTLSAGIAGEVADTLLALRAALDAAEAKLADSGPELLLHRLIDGERSQPGPTHRNPHDHEWIIGIGADHHAVLCMWDEALTELRKIVGSPDAPDQ